MGSEQPSGQQPVRGRIIGEGFNGHSEAALGYYKCLDR